MKHKLENLKIEKHESKITALVGSGIINDLTTTHDDFIITSIDKEEKKMQSRIHSALAEGKRTNSGFKTSAASMFTSQTGGKTNYSLADRK